MGSTAAVQTDHWVPLLQPVARKNRHQRLTADRSGTYWRRTTVKSSLLQMTSLAFGASLLLMAGPAPSMADDIIIGLITKTDTNPFFVKMKEGAEAKAKETRR